MLSYRISTEPVIHFTIEESICSYIEDNIHSLWKRLGFIYS